MVKPTDKLPTPSFPVFEDKPNFKPAFTPSEMLYFGVFGLNYFAQAAAKPEYFEGLDDATLVQAKMQASGRNQWSKNFFGVKAGMSYEAWIEMGLIYPEDPLGWFHWYCRFFNGRRHPRDRIQIQRYDNFVRWVVTGRGQFRDKGQVSPVICQSLLQWAWNPAEVFNLEDKTDYSHITPARAFKT